MATTHPAKLEPEKQNSLNHHKENHFTAGDTDDDVADGVSGGLTVPFALAAGLSAANAPSSIVLTAGLAEVAAGAISMGLGGYLAARSEADHYSRELKREQEEIVAVPDTEAAEVAEILAEYGIEPHEYSAVVNALRKKPQAWLDFMMKFELGREKPDPQRAVRSEMTISGSYIVGGLVPLIPYMFMQKAQDAVIASVVLTLITLLLLDTQRVDSRGAGPSSAHYKPLSLGPLLLLPLSALLKLYNDYKVDLFLSMICCLCCFLSFRWSWRPERIRSLVSNISYGCKFPYLLNE